MKKFLKILQGVVAAAATVLVTQPLAVQTLVPNQKVQTQMAAGLAIAGALLPALVEKKKKTGEE